MKYMLTQVWHYEHPPQDILALPKDFSVPLKAHKNYTAETMTVSL